MVEKRREALIAALQDTDENVRLEAAVALEKIEGLVELEELLQAFKEGNRLTRLRIIHALAQINEKRTYPPLIYALKLPEEDLRAAAIDALAQKGNPKVVPFILEKLRDHNPAVQVKAITALGNFPQQPEANSALKELAAISSGELLEAVIAAMGKLRDPDFEDNLIALLRHEDPQVRAKAATALGEMEVPGSAIPRE